MADGYILTPKAIGSFPYVFKADKQGKFGLTLIFPAGTDLKALREAAFAVALDNAKMDRARLLEAIRNRATSFRWPFRSGVEKIERGYPPDSTFITARSEQRPEVVDQRKQSIIDQSEIYPGVLLRASVRPYWYSTDGNKGVSWSLGPVQKLGEGEKMAGAPRAESVFDEVDDEGSVVRAGGSDELDDPLG